MKRLFRIVLMLLLVFPFNTQCIYNNYNGPKFFFKLPNKEYLTVWKRECHNDNRIGDVLIIPGKFKGDVLPDSISYIEASHFSYLRFNIINNSDHSLDNVYLVDEKLSKKVIIKDKVGSEKKFYKYQDYAEIFDNGPYTKKYIIEIDIHSNSAWAKTYTMSISIFYSSLGW